MDPNRLTSAEIEVRNCCDLIRNTERIHQENSVLIVGMPGAGKKTLLRFLCEGRNALRAEKNSIGEYHIIYETDKIKETCHCPAFFRCTGSEDVYCLYPAFGRTGGAQEIGKNLATSYFMKDVLRGVKKIKILVICTYWSIKEETNSDFRNLMDHVLMFVKNVDKYRESIALIVTKVDNHNIKENGESVLVDDTEIKRLIASRLKNFQKDIEKNADEDFVRKLNGLVDVFSNENERGFEKLDIIRKPYEDGLLHDMELMRVGKSRIREMIEEKLVFCATDPNDFKYPLPDQLKISIVKFCDEMNTNIRKRMDEIGAILEQSLESVENESHDIYSLRDTFSSTHEKLEMLLENETQNINTLYSSIMMDTLCYFQHSLSLPETYLEKIWNIGDQYECLKFLSLIYSDTRLEYSPLLWTGELKNVKKRIQNSSTFYSFLIDLYEKLSSYDVQKDVTRYMHLKDELPLVDENLQFCGEDTNFDKIKNLKINGTQMRYLKQLFQLTLSTDIFSHYFEDRDTYFIFGDFVKLSDVVMPIETKVLIIFATKIFVDANLVNTDRDLRRVFVIALIWEVIGDREIVLNGKDADNASPLTAASGCDGRPGPPGTSAGSFTAVGVRFLNGRNLKISAKGGKGGRGQNGGEGAKGSIVFYPASPKFSLNIGFNIHPMHNMHSSIHDIHVRRTKCGDGGRGGNGGKGGAAGQIKIFTSSTQKDRHGIRTLEEAGECGQPGSNGKRGDGRESSVLALPAVDDLNIDSSDDLPDDADFNVILTNYCQQLQEGRAEIEIFLHHILLEFDEIIKQLNVT